LCENRIYLLYKVRVSITSTGILKQRQIYLQTESETKMNAGNPLFTKTPETDSGTAHSRSLCASTASNDLGLFDKMPFFRSFGTSNLKSFLKKLLLYQHQTLQVLQPSCAHQQNTRNWYCPNSTAPIATICECERRKPHEDIALKYQHSGTSSSSSCAISLCICTKYQTISGIAISIKTHDSNRKQKHKKTL
jgi:hypothetical protein